MPLPLATLHGHQKRIYSVDVSPCGGRLISACDDSVFFREWSLETYERTARFRPEHRTITRAPVCYSADGSSLVAPLNARTVGVWSAEDHKLRAERTFDCEMELCFYAIALSPGDKYLAIGGSESNGRGSVACIWDFETGEMVHALPGHNHPVTSLAFHPHEQLFATAGMFDNTKFWTLPDEEFRTLKHHGRTVNQIAFSPDGSRLYTCGEGHLAAWEVASGEGFIVADNAFVHCLAISPLGDLLVVGGYDHITAFELPGCTQISRFESQSKSLVSDIAFTPCGQRFVSASTDKTINVWETASVFEAG